MPDTEKRRLRRGDLLLLLGLLAIALVLAVLTWALRAPGRTAVVRVDGEVLASFPLEEDRTYRIETADGGENLLVIEDGSARLTGANCPDHLCVNQGAIRYAGDSIICLPHGVVIEITGEGDALDLDAVAG